MHAVDKGKTKWQMRKVDPAEVETRARAMEASPPTAPIVCWEDVDIGRGGGGGGERGAGGGGGLHEQNTVLEGVGRKS